MLGAPGYPVSAALTFDIFALPLLAALEGAAPVDAPARARPGSRAGWRPRSAPTTGSASGSAASAAGSSPTPLPRGAGVLTSLVRADGLLVVPAALEGHDAGAQVEVRLLRDLDAVERTIVAIGSHDPVLDLAASLLRARDPIADAGQRAGRLARRARRAARRALPPRRLPPARPGDRRVHAAVDRARAARPRGRGRPARPPRAGADRRAGQPARRRRASPTCRALRYVNRQRGAGTRVLLDHELGQRRHRRRTASTATSARSRPTSRSRPRSRRAARTRAWA